MNRKFDFVSFVEILEICQNGFGIINARDITIELTSFFVSAYKKISPKQAPKIFDKEISDSENPNAVTNATAEGIIRRKDNLASKYKKTADQYDLNIFIEKMEEDISEFLLKFDAELLIEKINGAINKDDNFRESEKRKIFNFLQKDEFENYFIAVFIYVIKYGSEVKKNKNKSQKKDLEEQKDSQPSVHISNIYQGENYSLIEKEILNNVSLENILSPNTNLLSGKSIFHSLTESGRILVGVTALPFALKDENNTLDFEKLMDVKEKLELPLVVSSSVISEVPLIKTLFLQSEYNIITKETLDNVYLDNGTSFLSLSISKDKKDFLLNADSILRQLTNKSNSNNSKTALIVIKSSSLELSKFCGLIVEELFSEEDICIIEPSIDKRLKEEIVMYIIHDGFRARTKKDNEKDINYLTHKQPFLTLLRPTWGPARELFTKANLAPYITFNSLKDGATGDERNYVCAKAVSEKNDQWRDILYVDKDDEYYIRVNVHNNANPDLNLTANEVRLLVNLPSMGKIEQIKIDAIIDCPNARPTRIWNSAVFRSEKGVFSIKYVKDSAYYYNHNNNGLKIGGEDIFNRYVGAKIGINVLDGIIPSGRFSEGYLLFKVAVQFYSERS